jgi:hypothetical protein
MQTKLNKLEKTAIREMILEFKEAGGFVFSFGDIGLTLAITWEFSGAKNAKVGISWQADTETKFRRLVGAAVAMSRANYGFPVPVQKEFAGDFATSFHAMFKL